MTDPYPIFNVASDAGTSPEAMGSKPKFWYLDAKLGICLFKEARPGTGEHWAEKAAAELAALLGLPHATVELAICGDRRGIVTPRFVPDRGFLIHGNELLPAIVKDYPRGEGSRRAFFRIPQHTLQLVMQVVSARGVSTPLGWIMPDGITRSVDVFVGYLLLDAWICNTDRHHENWGLMLCPPDAGRLAQVCIAPTFDHASSLGRNESDENRERRMSRQDPRFTVEAYVEKSQSALYASEVDKRPLSTMSAFGQAARLVPQAARIWLARLAEIQESQIAEVFELLPDGWASASAVKFAVAMLMATQSKMMGLVGELK